jgi:peptidyl-prolyl cis-trans isomerase D
MIRILQQNNQAVKILFGVVIGLAVITMVITLVPGIFDSLGSSGDPNTYATVRSPGFFGKIFGESMTIPQTEVQRVAAQQVQRQGYPAQYAQFFLPQAGQMLVQRDVLKIEADKMGLQVTNADLAKELRLQYGQILYPNGEFIGQEKYRDLLQNQAGVTIAEFESQMKDDMEIGRLRDLITGGTTVGDNEVRDSYRVSGTKVKFDYAVISSADIGKDLNPTDADLQGFFKTNAARYATAAPETRKISYFSFGVDDLPGGFPKVPETAISAYYNNHQDQYKVEEQVKARHILISVPEGSDAKTDATAKATAEDVLKKIKAGGDFAALAKQYSTDPGSKDSGGELGWFGRKKMVPAFEQAAFALQPGQTSGLVKTSFGYHIIQVEEKQTAHTKTLAEVHDQIVPIVQQQSVGAAEKAYSDALVADAKKQGLDKAAAAHNLHVVTTDYLSRDGVVSGVSDGAALLSGAFGAAKGAAPAAATTGDGYAVYQVVDLKAAHAPTFEEWKSHILSDYRAQKVPELLSAQLKKLDDRAKALGDLHKAAAELKIPVKTSDLVGKDGQVPEVGSMGGQASVAFSLAKGAVSGPLNLGQNGVVLEVLDKQEPTADEIAKNFEQTKEQLLSERQEEVFRVYLGNLTDKYKKAGAIRMKEKAPAGLPTGS